MVHFNQTFDGGYAGFYRIFRYFDGEYRMLGLRAFEDGVQSEWAWLSQVHELFWDETGRIITYFGNEYHGGFQYEHLVLTDFYADMHLVRRMDYDDEWEAWQEHHWIEWRSERSNGSWIKDGWMNHNPTIFGTDVPLTPLVELQEEIMEAIKKRIR